MVASVTPTAGNLGCDPLTGKTVVELSGTITDLAHPSWAMAIQICGLTSTSASNEVSDSAIVG